MRNGQWINLNNKRRQQQLFLMNKKVVKYRSKSCTWLNRIIAIFSDNYWVSAALRPRCVHMLTQNHASTCQTKWMKRPTSVDPNFVRSTRENSKILNCPLDGSPMRLTRVGRSVATLMGVREVGVAQWAAGPIMAGAWATLWYQWRHCCSASESWAPASASASLSVPPRHCRALRLRLRLRTVGVLLSGRCGVRLPVAASSRWWDSLDVDHEVWPMAAIFTLRRRRPLFFLLRIFFTRFLGFFGRNILFQFYSIFLGWKLNVHLLLSSEIFQLFFFLIQNFFKFFIS